MTFTATVTPSPLDAIVHDAARKLLSLRMTRIVGQPDKTDADNLRSDLEALWTILDPVILAVGEFARENLPINDKAVKEYFTDQLRGALEGNATFALDEAGNELERDLIGRSDFNEHTTHHRAIAGV